MIFSSQLSPAALPFKFKWAGSFSAISNLKFVLQSVFCTSLACLSLDEQVDEEETWKKCSKKNGQVCTELNLKRQRSGWKSLNDRVHGESRSGESNNGSCGCGTLEGSLGN